MYSTDKIAILLATYNGEKYIAEQIESIRSQSYTDWKLYIHDDGSKDGTIMILCQYAREYPGKIVVVDGPSTGSAKDNFLYLMSVVDASYYMCADQDDVWLPEKVEKTLEVMKRLENTSVKGDGPTSGIGETHIVAPLKREKNTPRLVFTELTVTDEALGIKAERMSDYQGLDCKGISFSRALIQNVVTGCTMMINRALRDEMIQIGDTGDMLMHDWWAALTALRFGEVAFLETPTILYRQHGNNGVGAQNTASLLYNIKKMMQGDKIKKSLADTRAQARAFARQYGEGEDSLARRYGELEKAGKWARLRFYGKENVKKSTWKKNLGLLIWG